MNVWQRFALLHSRRSRRPASRGTCASLHIVQPGQGRNALKVKLFCPAKASSSSTCPMINPA